jgi:hypothetical protein
MSTTMDHRIETSGSVSLAVADSSVQGADVKSMPVSPNGLPSELLDELAQHLMQAALEAEMDEHLAAEAGRSGGRRPRSGGKTAVALLPGCPGTTSARCVQACTRPCVLSQAAGTTPAREEGLGPHAAPVDRPHHAVLPAQGRVYLTPAAGILRRRSR